MFDMFQRKATCRFYLGTHVPSWLGTAGVPLFVSRRRLAGRRAFPRALAPWALDSGGFTELNMHGRWVTTARDYVSEVRRVRDEIGMMEWAAVQDWMCEPVVRERTGETTGSHQGRTIRSYLELRDLAPDIPWAPVIQGWEIDDYRRHLDQYASAGIDLTSLPVVGVGSVCRRQHTSDAVRIFTLVNRAGVKAHGFGLKMAGLANAAHLMVSSDSLAWSFAARKSEPMPGHTHRTCANCMTYALAWRDRILDIPGVIEEYRQDVGSGARITPRMPARKSVRVRAPPAAPKASDAQLPLFPGAT
jgi:hypothetical protein